MSPNDFLDVTILKIVNAFSKKAIYGKQSTFQGNVLVFFLIKSYYYLN